MDQAKPDKKLRLSRRKLLASMSFLVVGAGLVLRGWISSGKPDRVALLSSLVDHLFPDNPPFPGGVKLRVHERFLEKADQNWQTKIWVEMLAEGLEKRDYLALSSDAQRALVQRCLVESSAGSSDPLAKAVRYTLDSCAKLYFTDPQTWGALSYRAPQPNGYPEYRNC